DAGAGPTSVVCSCTGPTASKNGSKAGAFSSRGGPEEAGVRDGFGFKPCNRSKAAPGFAEGNAVCRNADCQGSSRNETWRGPPANPLPRIPLVWAGAVLGLSTAVSRRGSGREAPGTVNL